MITADCARARSRGVESQPRSRIQTAVLLILAIGLAAIGMGTTATMF